MGNGDTREEAVQLIVIPDGQLKQQELLASSNSTELETNLQVARVDSGLMVISGSIACQFQHLSSKVFKNGGEINRSTASNPLSIIALK